MNNKKKTETKKRLKKKYIYIYKPAQNHRKGKRTYRKVYTDWANDDYTTYRDVDCWIRGAYLEIVS